jgi:hypothetical protein
MTNNIIGDISHFLLILAEELIAPMLLAWVTLSARQAGSALFSMAGKFLNDLPFWGVYQNRTGLLNAKTTSYYWSPCLPDRQVDQKYVLHKPISADISVENQNSVIHLVNNHIKLFYSYFANY